MKPVIYAHRGASGDAPENTMAAFRLALEQGAEGIELDVQMTADGELVVIHDETLDRTTSGHGLVAAQTYGAIRRLDASYTFPTFRGEQVPLLSDVMELLQDAPGVELNIELKNSMLPYDGMEEALIRMVRTYGMENRAVFSSFNHYSIEKLSRLAPDIECGILYVSNLFEPWAYAATAGARSLHPYLHSVTHAVVNGAHQAGMKVRPWTANEETEWKLLAQAGVDAIITNYPARLKALLEQQAVV